ncbi:MGMT family protein [Candidatus Uhrbacteria bacterium]|nr:MGMT family protein [Candidatus Uhrbacteria bacterium]
MRFQTRVWSLLRKIPRGRVTTYGDIACAIGQRRAARAVAQACARNPHPIVVPCHRVVRSDGRIGGYSGPGGVRQKIALLREEGIAVRQQCIVDPERRWHRF